MGHPAKWLEAPTHSVVWSYGLALVSIGTAWGLARAFLYFHLPPSFTSFALCAIAVTFWYGGIRPGILAALLSALIRSVAFEPGVAVISPIADDLAVLIFAVLMTLVTRARNELERRITERGAAFQEADNTLRRGMAEGTRAGTYLAEAQKLSHTGSFGWHVSSGKIYWSEETFRIFEFEPTIEPTLNIVFERIHPADRQSVRETIDSAARKAKGFDFEHRLLMPDGSVKYLRVVGRPTDSHAGDLEFVGAVTDNTQRMRTEQDLHVAMAERARLDRVRAEVGMALAQKGGLKEILHSCAEAMVHHLDAAFARIWTLSSDGRQLELQASAGVYTRLDGRYSRIPFGQFKIGRIAHERKPHLTNDVQNDPWIDSKDWARKEGMISFAGYPLVIEDRTVGVIGMFARKALAHSTLDALSFIADGIAQGIERKKAEEMLGQSEAFLAEAQRISQICCFGWVPSTGEILLSNETFSIFEFETGTELTLDLALERVHPEDRQFARQKLEAAAREQNDFDYENRLQMPDGRIKHVRVAGRPCRFGKLQDLLFVATVIDVTKSKLTELSLRQSERYLAEAEALTHVGSWAWRVEGREAIYLSDEWYRIYGLDPKDGMPNFEARMEPIHRDDRSRVIATIEQAMKHKAEYDVEFRLLLPSGTLKHVHAIGHPVLNAAGELVQFVGSSTDITERKHAEGQLRYSIDAIPALAWYGTPEGSVEFLNQRWLDYTGLSTEQAKGWGWEVAIHPDDLEPGVRLFKEALNAKRPYEIEARFRRHDGEFRWFLFRGSPWRDASGKVVKWFGANTDIEDLKRTEEALRASEQNFRLIVDNIPGLVVITNAEGKLEQVNRRVLEYFGKRFEELKGWTTNDAIHPDDLQNAIEWWKDTVKTGQTPSVDLRLHGADGTYHWFQSRGLTLRDSKDRILRCYYLLTDIDERKKTDEKLRRSEEMLLEAQRLSHTSSWRLDIRSGAVVVSPEGREIFGLTPDDDESVAETYFSRYHPDDRKRAQELFERCLIEKTALQSDHRLLLRDGTIKYLHVIGHPVLNESGDLVEYVGTTMDVTERRRAEEERETLRQAQAHLARISRITTMGELAASLAHEIKQPIAAAVTNAEACLQWLARDQPDFGEVHEAATEMVRESRRAAEIITRVRSLFKKEDITRIFVDINEVVIDAISLVREEAERSSISVRAALDRELPNIPADPVQLQQVLMNLTLNALEAMKGTGGIIAIRSQKDGDNRVLISVSDAGVGLPPGQADKVFDAFFTTKPQGTGMGLAISRTIIEAHGGRLWATANPDGGATFHFTLPSVLSVNA